LFNLTDPKWAKDIGFAPRGDFGWKTLGLGRQSTGPTLNKQIVANISSMNHYWGFFGLSTYVTEFKDSKNIEVTWEICIVRGIFLVGHGATRRALHIVSLLFPWVASFT
jgi:hypothetical protein